MPTSYRAFTQVFVDHMKSRAAWPAWKCATDWMREHGKGIKNDRYVDMKRGTAVPERYVVQFARLLMTPPNPDSVYLYSHNTVVDYLKNAGSPDPATLTLEAAIDLLCDPATTEPAQGPATDYLQMGFGALGQFIQLQRTIDNSVQRCRDERAVTAAIEWMYVDCGRQIGANPRLPLRDAVEAAQRHIRTPLEDYQRRAVAWWRANPWSVILGRGKDRPVSMSIMLPLSEEARNAILAGERMTYDCTPRDMITPTPYILSEAFGERPFELGGEPKTNPTFAIYLGLLAQISALSRYGQLRRGQPLRVLSFAATPTNRKRIVSFGYKPTGKLMRLTGIEFYERVLRTEILKPQEVFVHGILLALAGTIDSPPEP